jgi:hypothetical protein
MKMVAKQLSIFLENRQGRLMEVTRVLAEENINFSAFALPRTMNSASCAACF